MAEHFVQPPHWEWYIVGYFFCAGLAGGLYVLATMLRLWGSPRDEGAARTAFLIAFPLVVVCGILLTIDLGQPLRFWHMMINTTPGNTGLNFKPWSPISVGTWGLLVFGLFSFLAFLQSLGRFGRGNTIVEIIGSFFALFLCSYTGVVLSVSNQPIWSDSWAIGGLFVASALSGSAALLSLLARSRAGAEWTEPRLQVADGYFAVLELVMIVIFFVTLSQAGALNKMFSGQWLVLWILVLISLFPAFRGFVGGRRLQLAGAGSVVTTGTATGMGAISAIVVLVGVLLMRYIVIFSAQS
jgi:formate-dependent nitrite reductase membrane component NrfD